ncbi:hypothetical protein LDENG_00188180 [Lucifuga dentata]|nr:hypothetical protein LDENG_00188180 [Lucifuga dentata]
MSFMLDSPGPAGSVAPQPTLQQTVKPPFVRTLGVKTISPRIGLGLTQPRKCNSCYSSAHTFRACPQSYANKPRQPNPNHDPEEVISTTERQNKPHVQPQVAALEQLPGPSHQTQLQNQGYGNTPLALTDQVHCGVSHQDKLILMEQDSQSATAMASQAVSTSTETSLLLQDQPLAKQNEEYFIEKKQREWSEDLTIMSQTSDLVHLISTSSQLLQVSQKLLEEQMSQGDLPAGQLTPAVMATALSTKECRELLDFMLADLPTHNTLQWKSSF